MELNGLKEMQAAVGGRITASYPFEEQVALVSNEESIWMKMPFNRSVEGGYGGNFLGLFFVCGLDEDSFCSPDAGADGPLSGEIPPGGNPAGRTRQRGGDAEGGATAQARPGAAPAKGPRR